MDENRAAEGRKKRIYSLMKEPSYVPMREKELACIMQVQAEDRPELKRLLQELLAEGKICINKRGRYSIPEERLLVGIFISHQKGFGFVETDEETGDLYIAENRVNGAWHQDTVEVRLLPDRSGQRQEAEVVRIVARGMTQVVGTWQARTGFGFVIPDNSRLPADIYVPLERSKGAADGAKVVAEITDYGKGGRPGKNPEGKIVEILGSMDEPGVDILSIVRDFGIPESFPEKVEKQAARCAGKISAADEVGREDLRDLPMVTIDGEDAKDLDDAVSLYRKDGNYCLGVHIADVSNYVQENSALDREALKRGTSVYLTDRVIPMLPRELSNGICSLNEGEDRLALSCLMTVTPKGDVADYRLAETVICVNRRMTYTSVARILEEEDPEECALYEEFVPMFREMAELSAILRDKRNRKGALEFDFAESRILLDTEGHPVEISPRVRNTATKLIEDFMLLANETVAQHFYWLQVPFLYRSHESPDPEKVRQLGLFVRNFGYSIKIGQEEVHPMEFRKLLEKVEGKPEEALIGRMTLRSLRQACYTTECAGHFGLASRFYCHFTSPIRRYPDLQIHRIIRDQLRGRLNGERIAHYGEILPGVAKQTSRTERRAEEAEREVERMKKAEYMENHIGEVYEGVISGITGWGLYVELPNTVEGLVHVTQLEDDFYFYDEAACEMRGTQTGRVYKLGQRLRVRVRSADRLMRTTDFILAEEEWKEDDRDGGGSRAED